MRRSAPFIKTQLAVLSDQKVAPENRRIALEIASLKRLRRKPG